MPAPARAKTAHWAPLGPKTRPFRHGVRNGTPVDPPLARGTIIAARYRLDGLIGEGGMGRVYAAEHLALGRRVALKLLRPDASHDDRAARLRQEAKAASRIGHRAIVQIVDFDTTPDGLVYLAMELLRGESFEDWLERPGTLLDGVRWLAEAALGLHAAHAAGIVHRDVKPDNVFLHRLTDGNVQPKLLDFGLAKATATDLTQVETQAGTLLGTPYYLAPERALGRPLDPRTDLYSLGVMLYETLTGTVPFIDDSFMGILALHIKATPLDPRQAAPDRPLPAALCELTMALLAKDPALRPPSGAAVAEALQRIVADHGDALAALKTGPREVSGPADETTHLDVIAERSTAAPDVAMAPVSGTARTMLPQPAQDVEPAAGSKPTVPDGSGAGRTASSTAIAAGAVGGWTGPALVAPTRHEQPRAPARHAWKLALGGVAALLAGGALALALGGGAHRPVPTSSPASPSPGSAPAPNAAVAPAAKPAAEPEAEPEAKAPDKPADNPADKPADKPLDNGTTAVATKPPAPPPAPIKKRKTPRRQANDADASSASDDGPAAKSPPAGLPAFKDVFDE